MLLGVTPTDQTIHNDRLSPAAKWTLFSILITNIGNGINTITVGKILYDQTGSPASFGIIFILDYVISFLVQILAGSIIDRGDPKKVSVISDLFRGIIICFSAFMFTSDNAFWWIFLTSFVLNIAKPFYRSATFAIGPAIAAGNQLAKFNALSSSFLQAGQIIGISVVGFILEFLGAKFAFTINGVTYLIAGFALWIAHIPRIEKKADGNKISFKSLADDWKEIFSFLKLNTGLTLLIILSAGDFLSINIINLALVPVVIEKYNGVLYWISILDGALAIGGLLIGLITGVILNRLGKHNIIYLGMGVQSLLYLLLIYLNSSILLILFMVLCGASSILSITVFTTLIQQASKGPIKGRISSLRNLTLSLVAGVLIPFVTYGYNESLKIGLLTSSIICLLFTGIIFLFSRTSYLKSN